MNPETILLEMVRATAKLSVNGIPLTSMDTRLERADKDARTYFASKGIHVQERGK
jgi:hypothetical protein